MAKYIFDYSNLRGRIRAAGKTEGDLAREIGRTNSYMSKVLNGRSTFTTSDIVEICKVLKIASEDIPVYFFALKVHENGATT